MFLLVAAFLLLINDVRTDDDDYEDIWATETTEVFYTSTAISFAQKDKEMETNPSMDEKFIPNPNLNPYKAGNVWNRQPYTPMNIDFDAIGKWNPPTPPSFGIDLERFRNWKPPTIKFEAYTVPTIRYGRRRITDWKLFFTIFSIVLLVAFSFKLCIWLIPYCRSRKPVRNNLERIIIIRREPSPLQSDSVPSTTNPLLDELNSSQSDSPLPQTNLETRSNDSKRIVILIQRDASASQSEQSQQSGVEDLRSSDREGSSPYSDPPPPYVNCVREGMFQPPPSYSNCVRDGLISHPEPPPP